ncbi:MAG: dephospho-CoA kinase [Chitinophagaceae bacterium]|jgi:dephospho-CoA kinase
MLKIGLTGGIGSGKSTVAKVFESLGVPVYKADDEAKKLMATDPQLIDLIKKHFSEEVYKEGKLDKTYLASIVFNNKEKLELLNSLVHPFTIEDGKLWMNRQQTPYAIKEAALIFESGSQGEFDFIVGVYAPETLRIHRTIQRDKTDKELVRLRMQNQIKEEIKMKLCDEVLINNEQELLVPQIIALHEKLLAKAKSQ